MQPFYSSGMVIRNVTVPQQQPTRYLSSTVHSVLSTSIDYLLPSSTEVSSSTLLQSVSTRLIRSSCSAELRSLSDSDELTSPSAISSPSSVMPQSSTVFVEAASLILLKINSPLNTQI